MWKMTSLPSQGGTSFSSTESRMLKSVPDNSHGICKQLSSHGVALWSSSLSTQLLSPTVPFMYLLLPPLPFSHLFLSSSALLPPPFGHLGERALNCSGRKAANSEPVTEPVGWDLHGAWISFWSILPFWSTQNSCPTHSSSLQCSDSPQSLTEGEQCGTWRMGSGAAQALFSNSIHRCDSNTALLRDVFLSLCYFIECPQGQIHSCFLSPIPA